MTEPLLGRRGLGLAGLGALAGCAPGAASAQGRGGGGSVVRLPALPCADRPGELAGLLLEGPSQAGVVVFGRPFAPGALPRGAGLSARTAEGRPLPVQLDPTVRHPDGSVRHAVVSLEAPALARGARLGVVLSRGEASGAPPLDLAAALRGREAVVEIAPLRGDGAPWRAELVALLDRARGSPWQSGPLAVQRRLSLPVPAEAVGGVTSFRLIADVSARSDGTLWADVFFRNDLAMRPGGGVARHACRVLLDGREALRAEMEAHHQYRGFGRLLGAAPGGGPAPEPPAVRHDPGSLADTGAVARYDASLGIEESFLARLAEQRAGAWWNAPFDTRGLTSYMPTGGGRLDLGPVTAWQAAWLITGDPRAAAFCQDQAETAATIPWNLWDPGGGADGSGGWLDARRWPRIWSDGRGGRPPGGLAQPIWGHRDSGWGVNTTHQPDLAFLPYLLTGRRAFADQVMAQSAFNVVSTWPANRNPPGTPSGRDGLLVARNRQARGAAWSLRQVDGAAWIAPDGDPNQPYLREVAAANWAWLRGMIPEWTALQGEAHGWLVPHELGSSGTNIGPWQQDYVAGSVAAGARRGNEDARAFLAWMSNFLVGRFASEARGMNPRDGAAYQLVVGRPGGGIRPFATWREIGEATLAADLSNRDGWRRSQGEYPRLSLHALAQVAEVLGDEGAMRAFRWLEGAGAPFTDLAAHRRGAAYAVVPRGYARDPASAPRCLPARG